MSDQNDVDIRFYDNYIPGLPAGEYSITVKQQTTQDASGGESFPPDPYPSHISQRFSVAGPRFTLDPADVHRAFPANGATGQFGEYLPQLAINKRALPWERPLAFACNSEQQNTATPWLALLVFSDGELLTPTPASGTPAPPAAGSNANPTVTLSLPLQDVLSSTDVSPGPPTGIRGPNIAADQLDLGQGLSSTWCDVIEMTVATFKALLPAVPDLRWLAHVREVSPANKAANNAGAAPAWYSAFIANRFAVLSADDSSCKNIVHLVSLEGFEDCFDADGNPISPSAGPQGAYTRMRLVSLYSWTYTTQRAVGESFSQLMLDLLPDPQTDSDALLLKLPLPASATAGDAAQTAAFERVSYGYHPLQYAMRSGETSFAWYRGPLSPVVSERFLKTTDPSASSNPAMPFTASDAMIYNPSTGIFDQSYAAAWTSGRLLGLSSKPYATDLLQWRRTAHSLVDTLLENMRSPTLEPSFIADGILDSDGNLTTTGTQQLAEIISDDLITTAFKDFLAGEFATDIASQIGQPGSGQASPDSVSSTSSGTMSAAPSSTQSDLATLMANPSVVALLQQLSGMLPLGTTADELSGPITSLTLAAPGAVQDIGPGSTLTLTDSSGNVALLTTKALVTVGDTVITIDSVTLTTVLNTSATVDVAAGTIMPSSIVQWLAQRALLYGVPFNNLVPDPRMLPAESLRMFYIDRNWIDALLDGALSVGVQSSRDSQFNQLMRNPLHRTVDSILLQVRDQLLGIDQTGSQGSLGTMAGFLLRSALVSAWPGLDIEATDADGNPIKPLRLDRVSANVMLAIFADTPVSISFSQPGEGLVFGVEDHGIDARYLPGNSAGEPVGSVVPNVFLGTASIPTRGNGGDNPVLVINGSDGLVGKLEALYSSAPTLSPASFAVEMVRSPEQMIFKTPVNA